MKNRLGIPEKIRTAIEDSDFDAIVVSGPDNVQYLSGAFLPFSYCRLGQPVFLLWPKGASPVYICPAEWETVVRDSGWVEKIEAYDIDCIFNRPVGVDVIAYLMKQLGLSHPRLGIDKSRMLHVVYVELEKSLPGAELVECDEWLAGQRAVKTADEQALLEDIAGRTDHGINGAVHHVTVDRYQTALTLAEEIRVHCRERELDLVGYHAAARVASGDDTKRFWPLPPKFGFSRTRAFASGDLARMQMRACKDGYWSDAARIMTLGEPSEAQKTACDALVKLREIIMSKLKPGVPCCQVYEAVKKEAADLGLPLVDALDIGHGVGVTPNEPPFLNGSDDTVLAEGMVLALAPVIRNADGLALWMKDTVIITQSGCRLVGWYKDWREPYTPIASI